MKLKQGLKVRKVGSHYMMVDSQGKLVDMATVYTLNEVAARLWEEASGEEFGKKDLVDWLCKEYNVDEEQAAVDVEALLDKWREYGLVDE